MWCLVYALCRGVHGPYTPWMTSYTAVYTALFGSWTDHGPCTAVYTVCTRPWTAIYMGRKHGRVVHGHVPVHGRVYGPCTGPSMYRVHDQGRVQTVYTTVQGPCTWSVHNPYTALHGCASCTRACLRPVYKAVYRPWTRLCLGPVYTVVYRARYTAVFRLCTALYRVRKCLEQPCTRAVNTPGYRVHGRVRVINGPHTWPVNGRVHGPYTAFQTGNGRGLGP